MHLIHVESQSVVLVSELNVLPLLKQNTHRLHFQGKVSFSFVNWLFTPTSIFTNMTARLFVTLYSLARAKAKVYIYVLIN